MRPIPLTALLGADLNPATCKIHRAVWNGEHHPIDVLSNDPEGWQGWNSYRSNKDDFNRQFIFSLAQDRHDLTLWLFGGVWTDRAAGVLLATAAGDALGVPYEFNHPPRASAEREGLGMTPPHEAIPDHRCPRRGVREDGQECAPKAPVEALRAIEVSD